MKKTDRGLARIIPFFGMVLAISAFWNTPCSGQQPDQPLVVGWAQLDDSGLEGSYLHATVLLPQELMRSLAFITVRYPSKQEFKASQEKTRVSAQEAASLAVAAARKRRDFIALTVRDEAKRAAELLAAEGAVQVAEAKRAELLSSLGPAAAKETITTPDSGDSPGSVPVVVWPKHASGSLVDQVRDPAATCEKEQIDVLIYGSAGLAGNFIYFDISVYLAALGEVVWQGREYASPDGLDLAAASLTRPVAQAVMGRPYAMVTYSVQPPTATVSVDGKPVDTAYELFLEDGEHELQAAAVGYKPAMIPFSVQTGTDSVIPLALEMRPAVDFAISSEPPGAAVHIDGELAGVTPLAIAGTGYPRIARSSLPGYQDVQLVMKPDTLLEDIHIRLMPSDGLSFNERFDASKDRFYTSLGWFVLSLPVTVISGGLFQTYFDASAAASELYGGSIDPDVENSLNTGFYSTQTIFWVSAAASIGFAVNAVIRFVSYINSAR